MINKIKSWFNRPKDKEERASGIPLHVNPPLDTNEEVLVINKPEPDTITLLRHQLGSIDFKDVDQEDMSENERKAYCSHISGVYDILEKDIKKFLYEQLMFISNEAQTWDQVILGRGTFNGMDLLLEHWKKAHEEHLSNMKPEEEFDKNKLLPDIE